MAHDPPPVTLDTGTRLAYMRTFQSLEGTQMAWIRTALSLITFGFTIAKFFEFLHDGRGEAAPLFGAHTAGVLMIGMGMVALAIGTLQHWRQTQDLRKECPGLPRSLSGVTALMLALLGLGAFVGTILRY